jgi:hypothetical protein
MPGCCSLPSDWKHLIENQNVCPKCDCEGSKLETKELKDILYAKYWDLIIEDEDYYRCSNLKCAVSVFSRVDNMWFLMTDIQPDHIWK